MFHLVKIPPRSLLARRGRPMQSPDYALARSLQRRLLNPANNRPHYAECNARANAMIVVWSSLMFVIQRRSATNDRWARFSGKDEGRWDQCSKMTDRSDENVGAILIVSRNLPRIPAPVRNLMSGLSILNDDRVECSSTLRETDNFKGYFWTFYVDPGCFSMPKCTQESATFLLFSGKA